MHLMLRHVKGKRPAAQSKSGPAVFLEANQEVVAPLQSMSDPAMDTTGAACARRTAPTADSEPSGRGSDQQLQFVFDACQRVLGPSGLCQDSELLGCGLTSRGAFSLINLLRTDYGITIDLVDLMDHPTPKKLADRMDNLSHRELTGLWSPHLNYGVLDHGVHVLHRPVGAPADAPLFVAPGMGGSSLQFAQIAQDVGPNRLVVGLENMLNESSSIEELVTRHINVIEHFAPIGLVHLGGHSLGGYVMHQLTHRLQQLGREVGCLFLFDSWNPAQLASEPSAFVPVDSTEYLDEMARAVGLVITPEWRLMKTPKRLEEIAKFVHSENGLDVQSTAWMEVSLRNLENRGLDFSHLKVMNLAPLQCPIRVVLFNAVFHTLELERPPVVPWEPALETHPLHKPGEYCVIHCPANHYTILSDPTSCAIVQSALSAHMSAYDIMPLTSWSVAFMVLDTDFNNNTSKLAEALSRAVSKSEELLECTSENRMPCLNDTIRQLRIQAEQFQKQHAPKRS